MSPFTSSHYILSPLNLIHFTVYCITLQCIYIYIPLRMDFHMFSWDYLPISFYIPMKIPNDLPILSTSQRLLGQRLHLRFSPFGALGQLRDHLAGSKGETFTLKIQQGPFKNIQRIPSILLSSSKSRMPRKGTPPPRNQLQLWLWIRLRIMPSWTSSNWNCSKKTWIYWRQNSFQLFLEVMPLSIPTWGNSGEISGYTTTVRGVLSGLVGVITIVTIWHAITPGNR